jgi:hypothetical protein
VSDDANMPKFGGNTGDITNAAPSEPVVGEVISPSRAYPNLRPAWQKGQSGNKKGRPPRKVLTDAIARQLGKRVLAETMAEIETMVPNIRKVLGRAPTYADLLAWRTIQNAMKGNMVATRTILDRVEGRLPRELTLGESDEGRLDELIAALEIPPALPGEVNE